MLPGPSGEPPAASPRLLSSVPGRLNAGLGEDGEGARN